MSLLSFVDLAWPASRHLCTGVPCSDSRYSTSALEGKTDSICRIREYPILTRERLGGLTNFHYALSSGIAKKPTFKPLRRRTSKGLAAFVRKDQIADVCMLADRVLCADDEHGKRCLRSGPRRRGKPSSELGHQPSFDEASVDQM